MTTDTSQDPGPQVADAPLLGRGAGRPARPHRPPVPAGGGAGAGAALPGGAAGPGRAQERLAAGRGDGERHPRGVQRLLDAARWDADAVRDDLREPTSWSTWATRGRCSSSTRRASSRRGRSRSGCSGSTAARPGAGRTPRSPSSCATPRRRGGPSSTAPSICPRAGPRTRPGGGGGRAADGAVRHEAAAGPGDAPAGVRGGGAGGLGGGRHGVRHGPGAAAVAGGGAPRLRPGRALQAPRVDRGPAGDRPRRRWPGCRRTRGRGARPGRAARGRAGTTGPGSPWRAPRRRGGATGCWPAAA